MPKLVLISEGRPIKAYHVQDNSDILVGNSSSCGIRINSPKVATEHIWMLCNRGRCRLVALNEKFPVQVNNRFIKDHFLTAGDEIQIGNHRFCFSDDAHKPAPAPQQPSRASSKMQVKTTPSSPDYVQVLDGKRIGRIIPLDHCLMRLGKAKGNCAVIAHRKEGYFLSHLKGPIPPMINGNPIGDQACPLEDGNIIQIGKIRLAFHSQSH